jgi:hypothetical protein
MRACTVPVSRWTLSTLVDVPGAMINRTIAGAAGRVPGLRRLPMLKLLAVAEIGLLFREHFGMLEPSERRRLAALVRSGRGRARNLSSAERAELAALVAKAEPRLFAGRAADKLSPVRLPRRVVRGSKKRAAP